jgi:N,N'-diacetyllegionaminate synthase
MSIEIVAELAQGFEGRPELARLLMKAAAAAGADAAKYQLVYADELATPGYKYYELFKTLEMSDEVWSGLASYARELGTQLYVDVFGERSLRLAADIGVRVIKLHGTDIANVGFLERVARSTVPRVLLGAGGAHLSEVNRAIQVLADKQVVVLLGFQSYPTPNEANQIARVRALVERFAGQPNVSIGFADHAPPTDPLRYALAGMSAGAGATLIEKHLTLGKNMKLEDHESALNPDEFEEFVRVVRGCAEAWGRYDAADDFGMSEAERGYRKMIRRHVVTARDVAAGTKLAPSDVVLKRSASEDIITDLALVYGRTLKRAIKQDSPIAPTDLE